MTDSSPLRNITDAMNMEVIPSVKTNKALRSSLSRSSFRSSFKASKSKLDELFKSPLDAEVKRKRSRPDTDCISLHSVDFSDEEPKKKRRSSLAKVTSLAALLSPTAPVKKVGSTLQKSLSVWTLKTQKCSSTPCKDSLYCPTPPRRRQNVYWHETVSITDIENLSKTQIDRQETNIISEIEFWSRHVWILLPRCGDSLSSMKMLCEMLAIFELLRSEEDLVADLVMVKTTYHDSMKKLALLTDDELAKIFGHIELLVPVHQDLIEGLRSQQQPNGFTESIGPVLLSWVPKLDVYGKYCANQVIAKSVLDLKKRDSQINDFLERCQDSPFSRHLDLWNFLDVPRSRLVKYPLLLKTIRKYTPSEHEDVALIDDVLALLDGIIQMVDARTGQAKCEFIKDRLCYLDENQKSSLVDESQLVLCDGFMKNARRMTLYVILFDNVLLLTRHIVRDGMVFYQVYRDPLPTSDLVIEDVTDGSSSHGDGGSFKSVFAPSHSVRNAVRVSSSSTVSRAFVLQANDELDKRHWTQCIGSALSRVDRRQRRSQVADATAAAVSEADRSSSPLMDSETCRRRANRSPRCSPDVFATPLASSSKICSAGIDVFAAACGEPLDDLDE